MKDDKNHTTTIELAKSFNVSCSFKEIVSMFLDELDLKDRWDL
jgi:hypothetical protein